MHPPDDFERLLREAVRRKTAPPDFAAQVMAKVRQERVVEINWWQRRPALFAMAAALLVAAVIPPAVMEHQRHERAIEANRQLVLAMQITRSKIQAVKQRIQRKHS